MGKCYNKGWTVFQTNLLATIARRMIPDYPLDKDSLHDFALMTIKQQKAAEDCAKRKFKINAGLVSNCLDLVIKRKTLIKFNMFELTYNEIDFICDLPVEENANEVPAVHNRN